MLVGDVGTGATRTVKHSCRSSNALNANRELAAHEQRLEAVIEAAEPDQAIPTVIGVEQGQITPGA